MRVYLYSFIYIYIGLIQNIWIHIWCLTSLSCGVRSASARAFNTCAREVREQRQARARDARANRGARARGAQARPRCARVCARVCARTPSDARAQISSPRAQRSSPNRKLFARARILALLAHLARAPVFPRASRARAPVCACAPRSRMC